MSSTELYRVSSDGDVKWHCNFSNSWRGAILIWGNMAKRYLNKEIGSMMCGNMDDLWKLNKRLDIPSAHRVVLMSTYDKCVVHRERIPRLIQAYDDYYVEGWDMGNIPAFSFELGKLFLDRNCTAICWNQTSVCASPWEYHDNDEAIQYNIFTGADHWFLFDRLEEIEGEE